MTTKAHTPTQSPTTEITENPESYTFTPDYSNHTHPNEEWYKTILTDPSRLKEGKPIFATHEPEADWSELPFGKLSVKNDITGYDVRSSDISNEDLSIVEDYNDLTFNTDTIWPDKLPKGFDPKQILEFNKNPGLSIRALHEKGITGKGIGIAIIDQILLLDHEQYKDNLMYYERVHCIGEQANMHGAAVSSIAVGKDIGVAPDSKLYYIAETHGYYIDGNFNFDASIIADSILRVLEINKHLPEDEKIRVISISRGYNQNNNGYKELVNAIKKADAENIFVITTSVGRYYNLKLMGMSRDYLDAPNDFNSYSPARWIEDDFYKNPNKYQDYILVPMGSRTYAGCTGTSDYEICYEGGLSWAVPWLAGFYALCCQVKPDITPQEFIKIVKSTSVSTQISKNGKTYEFGKIINPAAVIAELKK